MRGTCQEAVEERMIQRRWARGLLIAGQMGKWGEEGPCDDGANRGPRVGTTQANRSQWNPMMLVSNGLYGRYGPAPGRPSAEVTRRFRFWTTALGGIDFALERGLGRQLLLRLACKEWGVRLDVTLDEEQLRGRHESAFRPFPVVRQTGASAQAAAHFETAAYARYCPSGCRTAGGLRESFLPSWSPLSFSPALEPTATGSSPTTCM